MSTDTFIAVFVQVGWFLLNELILFDWNTPFREYPLYPATYGDAIGDMFLNEVVGKLLTQYDNPDHVRLVYWVVD